MSFPLKKSALLLHTVSDAEHSVRQGVGNGESLILSTHASVTTYLQTEHQILSQCLSEYLDGDEIRTQYKKSFIDAEQLIEQLDQDYSSKINQHFRLNDVRFFKALYSFAAKYRDYNVIYYRAGSYYPLFHRAKGSLLHPFSINTGPGGNSLIDLIREEIIEDFERNTASYVEAIKFLDNLHHQYPIKLAITGNAIRSGIKAILFTFLRTRGVPILGGQHGFNYGLQHQYGHHFDSDFNHCDYFLSYGFTKRNLERLFPGKTVDMKCKILPLGSTIISKKHNRKIKKKTIDVIYPVQNSISMFYQALIRIQPHLLTSIQIKILSYLEKQVDHSIVIKPEASYSYETCSVIPLLKRLKHAELVDRIPFAGCLKKYAIRSVLIDHISSPLAEALPYDVEVFALGDPTDHFDPEALEILKRRIYYTQSLDELLGWIDSFLDNRLPPKRDDSFLNNYLVKEGSETKIRNLVANLAKGT